MVKVQLEQSSLSQLDFPKTPFLLQKTWYHPEVGSKLQLPSASRVISNAGSAWAHVPSSDSLYSVHPLFEAVRIGLRARLCRWMVGEEDDEEHKGELPGSRKERSA